MTRHRQGTRRLHGIACLLAPLGFLSLVGCTREPPPPPSNVDEFLRFYNDVDQRLYTVERTAEWHAATHVTDQTVGEQEGAVLARAVFHGSPYVIGSCRRLLDLKAGLTDLQFRELDKILLDAAEYPGTTPDLVRARVDAETHWDAVLNGSSYCLEEKDGHCLKTVDRNAIDEVLLISKDPKERQRYWEAGRRPGAALRPGLVELRDLRNRAARAMGYSSYFHLQAADYGMSVKEMMALMDRTVHDTAPLYDQIYTWAHGKLAERYGARTPAELPASWLGDEWGDEWLNLSDAPDQDAALRKKTKEWFVRQAERFYTSMGMPELPDSFWQNSDLYPPPAGAAAAKSQTPATWHIDRDGDVRCLMNVTPGFEWFDLAHRELGGAYNDLAYSNPNVPMVLRSSLNRAFHEAIGDLIAAAARRPSYLQQIGVTAGGSAPDPNQELLDEALDGGIVSLPFSAGVVTHFEYELYEQKLPPQRFNQRWWELVEQYQRLAAPAPRGDQDCDACAKPELIGDPARYYDHALAVLIQYQLNAYIARTILKQDPHSVNYYGNKVVGRWLWDLMSQGATKDWRQVLKDKTGEDLSSRALLEYYRPLAAYLARQSPTDVLGPQR